MTPMMRRSFSIGMMTALLLTACATTDLTSSWKDPSYQHQPRTILVVAMTRKPINKRIIEDEFVRQLKARGTDALASYTLMPDEKQGDREFIAKTMKDHGAEAVLISRMARKKTVHTFVPGRLTYPPSYYNNWRDYYGYGAQTVYTPGYTVEDEYAVMEVNLYDAGSEKLIWSASSETEIEGTNSGQIKSYVGVMVSTMNGLKILK